ncbi:unnamed protein product [Meloidogyne enterolobii]|uniref:Uncharacterized protein n=1 Tax=Meloidogyne enterolobii TaxID=390850 RepID=A0ACB0XS18_MELEN
MKLLFLDDWSVEVHLAGEHVHMHVEGAVFRYLFGRLEVLMVITLRLDYVHL